MNATPVFSRLARMAEWLDDKLTPTLGPPPLGPYDEVGERAVAVCPVCAHPMSEHRIDHTTSNTILTCPVVADPPLESFEPLNEVGMPKRKIV